MSDTDLPGQAGLKTGSEAGSEPWALAGQQLSSRLILGTGGVPSLEVLRRVLQASGTALTTVALRRVSPAGDGEGSLLGVLREAGVAAVGIDLALLGRDQEEQLGEAVEAGQRIGLGLAGREVPVSDVAASVDQVRDLGHRLGFAPQDLAAAVILTPPCGLADRSPEQARSELAWLRGVGRALREQDPEDSREGDPGRPEARR